MDFGLHTQTRTQPHRQARGHTATKPEHPQIHTKTTTQPHSHANMPSHNHTNSQTPQPPPPKHTKTQTHKHTATPAHQHTATLKRNAQNHNHITTQHTHTRKHANSYAPKETQARKHTTIQTCSHANSNLQMRNQTHKHTTRKHKNTHFGKWTDMGYLAPCLSLSKGISFGRMNPTFSLIPSELVGEVTKSLCEVAIMVCNSSQWRIFDCNKLNPQ